VAQLVLSQQQGDDGIALSIGEADRPHGGTSLPEATAKLR
jgi:hypothetical protein